MPLMASALALALTVASALAAYARSAQCRWPALRRRRRGAGVVSLVLATAASVLWIADLGIGAGLCALLAAWMLGAIVMPYLAWLSSAGAKPEQR